MDSDIGITTPCAVTDLLARCFGSFQSSRIFGVVGALGSGKSECLINFARAFRARGDDVALADIDIINPYFSVREITEILESEGLSIINPPEGTRWGDIPALSPAVGRAIFGEKRLFLDVGGDERGAMALTQFAPEIRSAEYALFLVVNVSRPLASSVEAICSLSKKLEDVSGISVSALISNTHLMQDTRLEDVRRGLAITREASQRLSLPLLCATIDKRFWQNTLACAEELEGVPLWPLRRTILLPWERGVMNG